MAFCCHVTTKAEWLQIIDIFHVWIMINDPTISNHRRHLARYFLCPYVSPALSLLHAIQIMFSKRKIFRLLFQCQPCCYLWKLKLAWVCINLPYSNNKPIYLSETYICTHPMYYTPSDDKVNKFEYEIRRLNCEMPCKPICTGQYTLGHTRVYVHICAHAHIDVHTGTRTCADTHGHMES